MFVVNRKGGSWDDAYTESLFVTQDEEVAKKYCHKANEVFKRIKMRFYEIDSELEDLDDESTRRNLLLQWWCKYHTLSDVNSNDYEPIEVR
jgi:uncharacterized protein (DUF1330 family)